jgi:hypothetical protein
MAAVVTIRHESHLRAVPDLPSDPAALPGLGQRPHLRLVADLPVRPSRVRYMVRRLVAALVLVAALAGSWAALSVMSSIELPPGSTSSVAMPQIVSGESVYVAGPGDTLWKIARALQPTGDVRPLVRELSELNGGSGLEVGQPVRLP